MINYPINIIIVDSSNNESEPISVENDPQLLSAIDAALNDNNCEFIKIPKGDQ